MLEIFVSDLLTTHKDDPNYPGLDFVGEIVRRPENMDSVRDLVFARQLITILSRFQENEIIAASDSLWRYFLNTLVLTQKGIVDHLSGYE